MSVKNSHNQLHQIFSWIHSLCLHQTLHYYHQRTLQWWSDMGHACNSRKLCFRLFPMWVIETVKLWRFVCPRSARSADDVTFLICLLPFFLSFFFLSSFLPSFLSSFFSFCITVADLVACTAAGQIYEIGVQERVDNLDINDSCGSTNLGKKSSRKKREVHLKFHISNILSYIVDNRYSVHQFMFISTYVREPYWLEFRTKKFVISVAL